MRAEPDVTSDELLRQLTQLAKGTSPACSYQSQESLTSGIVNGSKKPYMTMRLNRDTSTTRDLSMWM